MAHSDRDAISIPDQKESGRVGPEAGAPSREMNEQTRSLSLPKRDYKPEVKDGRH